MLRLISLSMLWLLLVVPAGASEPRLVQGVFLRLSEDIDVPAREAGVLAEVPASEGRLVEPGDLLARIEDDEIALLRDRAALEVEVARRQADRRIEKEYAEKVLAVAQAELARAERSRAAVPGAVSLTEIDRLRLEIEKAASEIRRIEHDQETAEVTHRLKQSELALAELRLKRHAIVAPTAGQVVEHYKRPGEWVEPGEKVMRLVRLDVLRAEGHLDAADATSDLLGAPVTLRLGSTGRTAREFRGRIVFLSPEVEPTTGQVLVRAEIENPILALRPGLRGEMLIDEDPSAGQSPPAEPVGRSNNEINP